MGYLTGRFFILVTGLVLLLPSLSIAATVQLPQTGQSKCYNATGTVISCAGTGQDGEMKTGLVWPDSRFTANTDDTVTDNLTGLIWTKDASSPKFSTCTGDAMQWQQALDYVKCLNTFFYLGHNDWRVPTVIELESLSNAHQTSSASWLNMQGFSGAETDLYWSSTSFAPNKSFAQTVFMGGGNVGSGHKLYQSMLVWPVRSEQSSLPYYLTIWRTGQTECYDADGAATLCTGTGQDGEFQAGAQWPSPRFTDNTDETITDNLTGLIWTKDANTPGPVLCDPSVNKSWQQSLDYISCLNNNNYLGFNDWRLPNRKELFSLLDFSKHGPSIPDGSPFANVQSGNYWSSTSLTYDGDTHTAVFIDMLDGYIDSDDKSYYNYAVWPVRAGEFVYTVISVSPASIDFGNIKAGTTSAEKVVTISNTGNTALEISSIELTGGDNIIFNIEAGSCASLTPTIPAESDCTVKVNFTAESIGSKTTTLRISSNDLNTPQLDVTLGGTGVEETCNLTLSPKSKTISAAGGEGSIGLKLRSACEWTASSDSEWLVITPDSGSKSGRIYYSISHNTETVARTGSITVGGKTFTIKQNGVSELSVSLSGLTVTKAGKYYKIRGDVIASNTSGTKAVGVIVKVYLSDDAEYGTGDKLLKTISVGTLNGNSSRKKALGGFRILDNPSGKYILVVIDPGEKIAEADETNNTAVSDVIP